MPTIVYENSIYCAIEKCAITRLIGYFGTVYKQKGNTRRDRAEEIFYPAINSFPSSVPISEVKNIYPNKYIFSFIRNPFDRVVSNYFFNRGPWKRKCGRWPEFDEYVFEMEKWNRVPLISTQLNIDVNFVGRLENFKEDFDRLHEILGADVKYSKDGKHPLNRIENQSRRQEPYRYYYTESTRREVENRYKIDLERFGYEF